MCSMRIFVNEIHTQPERVLFHTLKYNMCPYFCMLSIIAMPLSQIH